MIMESKRFERRSNCDSPPVLPPSPTTYSPHSRYENPSQKIRTNSRRSPSYSEQHRSGGRSSYRESSPDKRRKRRKRSRSTERSKKYTSRRRRSRSDSRGRSRSKERRRSFTPNRSTSRSISRSRTHSFSRSRSRSQSRCKSYSRRNRSRERRGDRRDYRTPSQESDTVTETAAVCEIQTIPVIQPPPVQSNAFKNDGSFMEMFKKMQESMQQKDAPATTSTVDDKPAAPPPLMVGKRRGGRILKTGMVAKQKAGPATAEQPKDAWSLYMAEVKKYREVCCQEEDNTRPLVK